MAAYKSATGAREVSVISALGIRFLKDDANEALLVQDNGYLARFYDAYPKAGVFQGFKHTEIVVTQAGFA
eukprot:12106439-Alexandrium_andersonii.AAC.1